MALKIKKGIALNLAGRVNDNEKELKAPVHCIAITPGDFPGSVPKLEVKAGDKVKSGTPLWHDKTDADIKFVSSVAGTVKEIVRGEKRRILRVEIEASGEQLAQTCDGKAVTEGEIKSCLKATGLWAMFRQLPFDIVPVDNRRPSNIFISAWDAAPLSPGFQNYLTPERRDWLDKGVEALAKLTDGKVYIGYKSTDKVETIPGAYAVEIEGSYPASLPSVLAANVAPVNKGETVWLGSVETVVRIGQAVSGSPVDWTFPVAVVGSEIDNPAIVNAPAGIQVKDLLQVVPLRCCDRHIRLISGNVFVGEKVDQDGFLRYPYRQLTAIPEGDDYSEFMGWASLSPKKISLSRSFPSFFNKKKEFRPDARLNGGRRAMVMSGEYDRYIPMDIMAEYLVKAILARDIERMEALGIYEVTPGDFSAAEYADTSKLELQKIVREGLDYMMKEVGTGD